MTPSPLTPEDAGGRHVAQEPPLAPASAPASAGFQAASRLVLDHLNRYMPIGLWSVTRVQNDRQTHLHLDDNSYGAQRGDGCAWEDSYCVHMAAGTAPRVAPDAQAVPEYAAAAANATTAIAAYAGAPITDQDGTLFGALCGIAPEQRPELAEFEPVLSLLGELLSLALAADRALHLAEHASRTALTHATTDALTGVRNRRGWDEALEALDRDFDTYADPTVVVVVDLDNLKLVNDGPGGHAAGDALLRKAADVLRSQVREHDLPARLGGDEFGIVLTNCPASRAPALAERITRALDDAHVPASLGWAALEPGRSARSAVESADRRMYAEKLRRRGAPGRTSPAAADAKYYDVLVSAGGSTS